MIKLLIFDLDGTAIPNKKDGMPSQRLINAVNKAQKKIKVSAATGRPISTCRRILNALNIKNPCVISGGTEIINPTTEEVLWKKELSIEQVRAAIKIIRSYNYQVFLSNAEQSYTARETSVNHPEQIIYVGTVRKTDTEDIMKELKKIKNITAFRVKSWTPDHIDIHITHKDATKKHALEKLLEIENVDRESVMVVGDSGNDMPLFEVGGIKVAMGNAAEELKKISDIIIPSIDEDGLAQLIEEKILNNIPID